MNLTFPQLLAGSIGALLIYCAIINKTPVAVMKDAMKGQEKAAPAGTRGITPNTLNSALTGKTDLAGRPLPGK